MTYPPAGQYWAPTEPDRPIFVGDVLRTETILPNERADFVLIIGPAQLTTTIWYAPLQLISAHHHLDPATIRAGRHPGPSIWVPDWHHPAGSDWHADLTMIGSTSNQTPDVLRDRIASASAPAWIAITHRLSLYATGSGINGSQHLLEHAIEYPRSRQEIVV